jgi:uncharacterized RDD family membrane protein YckC
MEVGGRQPEQPERGGAPHEGGPESSGPQSPAPGPESPTAPPPSYGGPVPPGGWQQPPPPAFAPGAFKLASWWSRVGAYVIDALIIGVPAVILMAVLGIGAVASADDDGFGAFVGGFILTVLAFVVIAFIYAPILMSRPGVNNGQTWGKQLLGIRVIRTNGETFTFGPAALREIVFKNLAVGIASAIIPVIPWFLNFFWPLWDDQNRALHDMAASTRVVEA